LEIIFMQYLHKMWPVIYQTSAIYFVLIAGLILIGRGRLGQLTSVDLVMVLLLGTCVETSMIAFNNHLDAGLVSAGTLLVLNYSFSRLVLRSGILQRWIAPEPLLLVRDGQIEWENAVHAGLTAREIKEALREREVEDLKCVKYAVMEADGTINVIRKPSAPSAPSNTESIAVP
jgi:uncharacterized membrane protein YcaP (DUF421 family)